MFFHMADTLFRMRPTSGCRRIAPLYDEHVLMGIIGFSHIEKTG